MDINLLEDRCWAVVRTGRLGATQIEWTSPFQVRLNIQKDGRGQVCALALMDTDFAEFDPRYDLEEPTLLVTEDYALEILEAPLNKKG